MTQTTLPLTVPSSDSPDDFIVTACNAGAYNAVMEPWSHPILILVGEPYSGKKKLGAKWQRATGGEVMRGVYDNEALFHACNRALHDNKNLLVLLEQHPNHFSIGLADLRSRLLASPVVEVGAPDENLLSQLLVKQLSARQLRVEPNIVDYLLTRMERSYQALHELVEDLDVISLRDKKPISMAIAREALGL